MRLTRARYVTICQQFLVTAAVVAVGLSAAGVMTLQIVSPEDRGPDASAMAPAVDTSEAYVASRPVMPKVREIKVAPKIAPKSATKVAPEISAARVDAKADRTAALSAPTAVHGYATVGVTWKPGTKLAEDAIASRFVPRRTGPGLPGRPRRTTTTTARTRLRPMVTAPSGRVPTRSSSV